MRIVAKPHTAVLESLCHDHGFQSSDPEPQVAEELLELDWSKEAIVHNRCTAIVRS
jgi:hypothetical protein